MCPGAPGLARNSRSLVRNVTIRDCQRQTSFLENWSSSRRTRVIRSLREREPTPGTERFANAGTSCGKQGRTTCGTPATGERVRTRSSWGWPLRRTASTGRACQRTRFSQRTGWKICAVVKAGWGVHDVRRRARRHRPSTHVTDRCTWHDQGSLDIRQTDGQPISPGPYGTPTVWIEDGTLVPVLRARRCGRLVGQLHRSESMDERAGRTGVPARSRPLRSAGRGPEPGHQVPGSLLCVLPRYGTTPWKDWCTNVAVSTDLIHWRKYPRNPLVAGDKSSGIVVHDGTRFRLYTMHPDVRLYFGRK